MTVKGIMTVLGGGGVVGQTGFYECCDCTRVGNDTDCALVWFKLPIRDYKDWISD
jgi:hypothetical protein